MSARSDYADLLHAMSDEALEEECVRVITVNTGRSRKTCEWDECLVACGRRAGGADIWRRAAAAVKAEQTARQQGNAEALRRRLEGGRP